MRFNGDWSEVITDIAKFKTYQKRKW
jgi:hypothetical protein